MSLVSEIKLHEGFRGNPYKDTKGNLTVGYGTRLPITKTEATMLLTARLGVKLNELAYKLPFWDMLTPARKEVFGEMAYNLGVTGFMKFKKMISAASKNDIDGVCREMKDSLWYEDVGARADYLINKYRVG